MTPSRQESKPHEAPAPKAGESWAGFLIEAVVADQPPAKTRIPPTSPVRPTARTRILTTKPDSDDVETPT